MPYHELKKQEKWIGQSVIENFFSWTEHIFIHIAILNQKLTTGKDVADLSNSDWACKYKKALDISDPKIKSYYDKLTVIRRQLRNYMAHGAF
jgi:hypothetical protein